MKWVYAQAATLRPAAKVTVILAVGNYANYRVGTYDANTKRWSIGDDETIPDARVMRWAYIEEDAMDKMTPARREVLSLIGKEMEWSALFSPGSGGTVPSAGPSSLVTPDGGPVEDTPGSMPSTATPVDIGSVFADLDAAFVDKNK